MKKEWKFNKGKAYFGTEGIPGDIEEYETSDIYEGAYLLSKDMKLMEIKKNMRGRMTMRFEGDEIKKIALGYLNSETVPVRKYSNYCIELKEKIMKEMKK